MSKENVVEMLIIDTVYVRELIITYGGIGAIEVLNECFDGGPVSAERRIPDPTLRLMIWNISQSLDKLEETTKKSYSCIESIQHLSQITTDEPTKTITRHIVDGVYALTTHVT